MAGHKKSKAPPNKFSQKKRAKIVADYVELGSYAAAARENGCSWQAVKSIVAKEPDLKAKIEERKNAHARDLISHMDSQLEKVCLTTDRLLEEITRPERLEQASSRDLATVLGILIDKYTKFHEAQQEPVQFVLGDGLEELSK